ncbi:DUF6612 family protein [Paenibacillus azoreducens]|uniref:DUF6612 family protein n=1 Tax=Paenibacillus azoreducens TaxID=116718 RepID=UPI0039F46AA3
MRRWTVVLLGAILAFGMTACGKDKEANGEAKSANPSQEVEEKATPTFDELVPKVVKASNGMKSFTMETTINIMVTQGGQIQNQRADIAVKRNVTRVPLQMYQEIKSKIPSSGNQEIKQYFTDEDIYSSVNGKWMKLHDEQKALVFAKFRELETPEKQLERLKSVAKDTKVTVAGDEYIVTAEMSGDGVKELAKSLMSQSGGGQQADQMDIKNIKVEYAVNKKSLYLTKANVEMTMNMEAEGQSISLEMKMNSNFSKYNEIEKIEVPQEVLDSAA